MDKYEVPSEWAEHIRRLTDKWPEPTPKQVEKVVGILRGNRSAPPAIRPNARRKTFKDGGGNRVSRK